MVLLVYIHFSSCRMCFPFYESNLPIDVMYFNVCMTVFGLFNSFPDLILPMPIYLPFALYIFGFLIGSAPLFRFHICTHNMNAEAMKIMIESTCVFPNCMSIVMMFLLMMSLYSLKSALELMMRRRIFKIRTCSFHSLLRWIFFLFLWCSLSALILGACIPTFCD